MTTAFEKFKLLLWKDWLLQWNHKIGLAVELLMPVMFTFLLVCLRTLVAPTMLGKTLYLKGTFGLDDLKYTRHWIDIKERRYTDPHFYLRRVKRQVVKKLKYHVAFSPGSSPVFTKIISATAKKLDLTFSGHENGKVLEKYLMSDNIYVGVEFPDRQAGLTTYPRHLRFSLRYPSELRTALTMKLTSWMTNILFYDMDPLGPRNRGFKDGGLVNYYREGFLTMQHTISAMYIQQASAKSPAMPKVTVRRFPYPEVTWDPLLNSVGAMMVIIILLSYIYPVTYTVKLITMEKEKQLKEVMKIMGLDNWIHWVAWFARSLITMSLSTLLIVFILKVKWSKNVAVLTYSSFTAIFFFLTMYVIQSIFFCFMLATLFSKANTGAAVTGLIWFVTYLPYIFIDRNYDDLSTFVKTILGVFSNTAMGLGVKIVQSKELEGSGLKWSNMFEPTSPDDNLSFVHIYTIMIISSIIYMILCLYFEQIFPGEYGLPKPWNFPFKKNFWIDTPEQVAIKARRSSVKVLRDDMEPDTPNEIVGVEVRGLYKTFGDKIAVNSLWLNMYENETTVLLGHNGAGKTTTIMILTGMIRPTAGTAIINGFDIREDMEGARMSLGICPQHNVLFDDLTVRNHLEFFSRLKGLKGEELEDEVDTFIKKIGLEKKADLMSCNLSGGMKRKLSICTAFCGGTKVVLCDEPSSGLDPAARRKLWEFIQSEKKGRTVLLTTHFMDEAEVLGDRIAIMRAGRIQAYGTAFNLKKQHGEGYKLICEKGEGCVSMEVTALLNKYIPGLRPSSEVGVELSYILPEDYSGKFASMLEELETKSAELHLLGYGISLTSLEDVFLKVGAEQPEVKLEVARKSIIEHLPEEITVFDHQELKSGKQLHQSQWRAMFFKKFTYSRNNLPLFILQNLIPLIFIISTIIAVKLSVFGGLVPRLLDLTAFPITLSAAQVMPDVKDTSIPYTIYRNYRRYVLSLHGDHKIRRSYSKRIEDYIMDMGRKNQAWVDKRFINAAIFRTNQIEVLFNNEPLHSAPIALDVVENGMARTFVGDDSHIKVTNKPLPYSSRKSLQNLEDWNNEGTQIALNMSFCMAFVSAFYVLFPVTEYETRAKLLQFVAGVRVLTFWLSHFICDMATYCITVLVVLFTLIISQESGYSTVVELLRYLLILLIFGFASLWFVYLLSYLFEEPAVGFSRLTVFFFFTGNACLMLVLVMGFEEMNEKAKADRLRTIFLFMPHFSMALAFMDVYKNSQLHKLCAPYMSMNDTTRCFYFKSCCKLHPYFGWQEPGILSPLVHILFSGCVFGILVILREYRVWDEHWIRVKSSISAPPPMLKQDHYDEDVEEEKKKIQKMTPEEIATKNLVIVNLKKNYGPFVAVNGISFLVEREQCFGLLGVNGAGKTTTFKMLTGDEKISSGDVFVTGISMKKDLHTVYQKIGYCPQFDALFDDFTGRDMLKMFALLRGIPDENIDDISEDLAIALGFSRHIDKPSGTYSGGNKRKLSTALAVIGNPVCVYLDEPTTGMDPAARRRFWDAICAIRDSGKSIVLTTHSMEECEALCTRNAIMVNGEIKCIGSTQHLKGKFSKGLILKIQLKREPEIQRRRSSEVPSRRPTLLQLEDGDVSSVTLFIKSQFPQSYLQARYRRILTYHITLTDITWSKVFEILESNKDRLNIQDYTISQTTLEEIFLQIALYQAEDPREIEALRQKQNKPSFRKMMSSMSFSRTKQ